MKIFTISTNLYVLKISSWIVNRFFVVLHKISFMGKSNLRDSKVCENCGASVAVRFCSTCGQENIHTRKSFHYLFTHFLEDVTHYDNGFWKALKFLLYKPFELTHAYLEGKRKMFVPPVKLFIFINFLTFLIFGLLPKNEDVFLHPTVPNASLS